MHCFLKHNNFSFFVKFNKNSYASIIIIITAFCIILTNKCYKTTGFGTTGWRFTILLFCNSYL